jgi:hypothetical protein
MTRNAITKARKMGIVTVASVMFLIALMTPTIVQVHATTANLVTGLSTATNETATVVGASGNLIFESITSQLTFTGGLVGSGTASAFAIINIVTGHIAFTEQALFTGTIMGSKSGSIIILISGSGSLTNGTHAHDFLVDGTGGLAGLHAKGTQVTAAGSNTTSFSLRVHIGSD